MKTIRSETLRVIHAVIVVSAYRSIVDGGCGGNGGGTELHTRQKYLPTQSGLVDC